ncbi:hypothetical protein F4824DRAFT_486381 [Ustulina deusta]|nr:hypothetical protein F4824DRAFT_486381 [Ustulina deusta]
MEGSSRLGNLERARWRTKCRKMLAQHIEKQLGLHLNPSQVRLNTTRNDAYSWETLPEARHLFSKNLSDHSVGAYKELCDNVGVTFEAVRRVSEPLQKPSGQGIFSSVHPELPSLTSRIGELEAQNDYFSEQLYLRASLEEKLRLAYERSEGLQKELQAAACGEAYFRNRAGKYSQTKSV